METADRIQKYLDTIPSAVSGQHGHDRAFYVACVLVNGFGLPIEEATFHMEQYSQRCSPPWSAREIAHKLESAMAAHHDKPRGHLLERGATHTFAHRGNGSGQKMSAPDKTTPEPDKNPPGSYELDPRPLPPPLPDPTRALIRTVFQPGDYIRIVPARFGDDGREVPNGVGETLSRETWLERLDKWEGDFSQSFASVDGLGVYIAMNPLKEGGSKAADVTAYRHALLEFDESLTLEQQYSLYTISNLPCAAIIYSGGRSIHAWVVIGAKDPVQFRERVNILHNHFKAFNPDTANRDPGRLSRLPGCVRFKNRQELLSLRCGAESFEAWAESVTVQDFGIQTKLSDLRAFDEKNDPNNLLGNRWLCKGGSCMLVGQSGTGKSSLALQFAMDWALGLPTFGIYPVRPLKTLFIQAENDLGDMAEMYKGILHGMALPPSMTADQAHAQLESNLVILRDTHTTGLAFTQGAYRAICKHKPDLVICDPFLSFIGGDVSKQEVCSQFLRNWINPISDTTGVTWIMVHHTGKPSKDPKSQSGFTDSDFAYSGLGSSELNNWPRETMILRRLKGRKNDPSEPGYSLTLCKRGKRASMKDPEMNDTTTVYLKHSALGIRWVQTAEPQEPLNLKVSIEKEVNIGPAAEPPKPQQEKHLDIERLFASMGAGSFTALGIQQRVKDLFDIGRSVFYDKHWNTIRGMLLCDPKTGRYSVPLASRPVSPEVQPELPGPECPF